jgi:hypothetical protein
MTPMAARFKAWFCGRSLAGTAGSNPTVRMDVFCECCVFQVEVSAVGRFLVQWSPTKCVLLSVIKLTC